MYIANPNVPVMVSLIVPKQTASMCFIMTHKNERALAF